MKNQKKTWKDSAFTAEQESKFIEKNSALLGLNKDYDRMYNSCLDCSFWDDSETDLEIRQELEKKLVMFNAAVSNALSSDFAFMFLYITLPKDLKKYAKKYMAKLADFCQKVKNISEELNREFEKVGTDTIASL